MTRAALAAVLVGPRRIELDRLPLTPPGPEEGWLRVEATGVCGADWAPYLGQRYDFFHVPAILGHEIVGRVEELGDEARRRWGVEAGDRVVLEEPLRCGRCPACLAGRYQMCPAPRYGSKSVSEPPGLWGGYAEYVHLEARTLLHRAPEHVPPAVAALYVPVSNGVYWVGEVGGARTGSTVVVQGPGQHGLGCVVAARELGAAQIIVLGLARDAGRLALAAELGATATVAVDEQDAVAAVAELTGGALADVVVSVTEGAPRALAEAVAVAGDRATVVLAGTAHRPAVDLVADEVMEKELAIRGVRGRYGPAIRAALRIIGSGRYPLERLCTHHFPIEETERALQTLGGEGEAGAIHVAVVPGGEHARPSHG